MSRDEVPGRVVAQLGVGRALAAAALVEQDDAVGGRIEEAPVLGSVPPPGPPCRNTTGLPSGFPLSSQ